MANGTTKNRKGTTNPSIPYPQISDVKTPEVGKRGEGNPVTKQRGHGAAQRGFTSRGPMA